MKLFLCVAVTCAPNQFACSDGTCVGTTTLCDGTTDCPGGEDENRTNCYIRITTPSPSPVTPTVPTLGNNSHDFQFSVFSFFSTLSLFYIPLFLQLVDPTSSAVPLVGSVCLRPGAVMGKQTVWMGVMNSSVQLPVALARCLASVGTSVWTTNSSVMGPHTAGMLQMRVSTTVVSYCEYNVEKQNIRGNL